METSSKPEWSLNPMDRAGELLFGLIMALTFTCSISVATAHRVEIQELLIGAVGCNLAWGLVDGTMFLIGTWAWRHRALAMLNSVRTSADKVKGQKLVADALPPVVASVMPQEVLEDIRKRLIDLPEGRLSVKVTPNDIWQAAQISFIAFVSTLPVVLPFLFIKDSIVALRTSNAIAIAMMFWCGWSVASYTGLNKWRMSSAMVVIGVIMVVVTIGLGG